MCVKCEEFDICGVLYYRNVCVKCEEFDVCCITGMCV